MDSGSAIFDVVVVGSGPAGACAARGAAAGGMKVVMLEKGEVPRYKTCGGGILGRAMGMLGGELPVVERACHVAEFGLSAGLRFRVEREVPIVWMTMRDRFDAWLVEKAVAAGAELRVNCAVRELVVEKEWVRVVTERGEIRARYVVGADGANSVVARQGGWAGYGCVAPAVECEVWVEDLERWVGGARFDFDAVPRGYGWVFPKGGHLSIGVMTVGSGVNLRACFAGYLERLGIVPVRMERHGFVIPLMPRSEELARDGILLVGDAAGLADPVTAEGISHAILSGQLAGRALVGGEGDRGRVMAQYNAAVGREILGELRWARRLARVMYGMPRVREGLFRWQGERLAGVMGDVVAGRRKYGELMESAGNYWKLVRG